MSRFHCPVPPHFITAVCLIAILAFPVMAAEPPPAAGPRISTYAAYELRLQRIETSWPDMRAVTTRQAGGGYTAALVDHAGRQLAQRWLAAPPVDSSLPEGEISISRLNETLERQYRRGSRSGPLNRGTLGPDASRNDGETVLDARMPSRVTMEFERFTADTFQDPVIAASARTKDTAYSTFHTVLRDNVTGKELGILRWFAIEQVLVWRIEGMGKLGEGLITPARLEATGGWKFTPDMVWAGIQVVVMRDSADRVKTRREMSVVNLEVGTLDCDGLSDGCTGLHWLDETLYRQCCDVHDACFEYAPPDGCCTAWSWIYPRDWQCVKCNLEVLRCFITGGGYPGTYRGTEGTEECTTSGDTPWCPPSCMSCPIGGGTRPRI